MIVGPGGPGLRVTPDSRAGLGLRLRACALSLKTNPGPAAARTYAAGKTRTEVSWSAAPAGNRLVRYPVPLWELIPSHSFMEQSRLLAYTMLKSRTSSWSC